jgi:hypothetical protein
MGDDVVLTLFMSAVQNDDLCFIPRDNET